MKQTIYICDICGKKITNRKVMLVSGRVEESKQEIAREFDVHKKCAKDFRNKLRCIGEQFNQDDTCPICGERFTEGDLRLKVTELAGLPIPPEVSSLEFHKDCVRTGEGRTFIDEINDLYDRLCNESGTRRVPEPPIGIFDKPVVKPFGKESLKWKKI